MKRLSMHFNLEIQSDHFGNGRSLPIEGCNIEFIDEDHNVESEFNSHLSDDSRQDESTTHAYIISMLNNLEKGKHLNLNVLFGKILIVFLRNIVVVYRCIFFCYFRLTLTLPLIE